jgi:hypothetical protein
MGPFRKLLLVGLGVLALHGVQACASDTELNPQPLPPGGGTSGEPTQAPSEADDGKNAGSGDFGGGTTPTPPAADADAGADGGDAGDGGGG